MSVDDKIRKEQKQREPYLMWLAVNKPIPLLTDKQMAALKREMKKKPTAQDIERYKRAMSINLS